MWLFPLHVFIGVRYMGSEYRVRGPPETVTKQRDCAESSPVCHGRSNGGEPVPGPRSLQVRVVGCRDPCQCEPRSLARSSSSWR